MIIKTAEFVTSMSQYGPFATASLPEIAFAGRSNVGKSSMINCITGRNGLARTSQSPGRTRLINVFLINQQMNLVDLPGYGFARVSRSELQSWGEMMDGYFGNTDCLKHVFHLVDIRHEPSKEDREMNAFLRANGFAFTVIATKADKVSYSQQKSNLNMICRTLQVQPWQIIPFSSKTKAGRAEILNRMEEVCRESEGEGQEPNG